MADAGFYRGTNSDQDSRFTDKEKKLLKSMKFEDKLDVKIDLQRVNIEVIKPWITARLNELLGVEDEVVVEYVFSLLEDNNLNPKVMQINLTGFLNARRSREFMAELWELLDEAQKTDDGIPPRILEKKVQEMKKAKIEVKTEPTEERECDWRQRYDNLTGGRYGGSSSSGRPEEGRRRDKEGRDREGRDREGRDRDEIRERRGGDDVRNRTRNCDDDRDRGRRRRSRSRSPRRRRKDSRSPRRRRSSSPHESDHRDKSRRKKDRSRSQRSPRRHRDSSSDRKHKKEKKSKRDHDRD